MIFVKPKSIEEAGKTRVGWRFSQLPTIVATVAYWTFAVLAADQEVIRLHSGQAILGEVLKDRPETLYVDIGYQILVIPKKEIASRSKGEAALTAQAESGRYGDTGTLFSTADLPGGVPIKDLINRFGEGVVQIKTPSGSGSGFLIDEDGHCITNYHVIEGETRITVDLFPQSQGAISEKSIKDVEIVATSPFFDLALLKLPKSDNIKFKKVFFGFYDEIRQGEMAFAIGNPLGLTRSVTQGIISNKSRNVKGQLYIQTSTQINPGNSGGPLFNSRGQVIGVTNMRITVGEGLAFAIPIDYVKDFIRYREAYAYNKDNPNEGYRYLDPPRRPSAK